MNESTPFALGSLPERIANWLYVLDKRIFILEPTIRYLQDRSLWIYDETTANIIDIAGLEYGVHLNAGAAYHIQILNTFCNELGADAWEAGLQLEEEGITIDIQKFIEDHRPTASKREDDEQLQHALAAAIAEHRRLCRVRLAALKRLRDLSQTEGSQIGHSYQVDMGTGSFWEILTVPNVKKGCQYKLPSTEDHMENVLSAPWEYKISIDKRGVDQKEPLFIHGIYISANQTANVEALISRELNLPHPEENEDMSEQYPYQNWRKTCRKNPLLREFIKTH